MYTFLSSLCYDHSQVEIPNILKQRKQLAKLVLDYDSARARCVYSSVCLHFFLLVR